MDSYRITVTRTPRPHKAFINDELQWFAQAIGIFGNRDKERTNFRIFIELLKACKHDQSLSSDDIASKLHLSRATIVHHLNKLLDAGIASHHRNKYALRADSLRYLTEEIEKDIKRAMGDIKQVAEELDKVLSL